MNKYINSLYAFIAYGRITIGVEKIPLFFRIHWKGDKRNIVITEEFT